MDTDYTREGILQKLATYVSDKLATETSWARLLDEEDEAQAALHTRFSSRREVLTDKDDELEFLSHIEVFEGQPIYVENDRDLHTLRSFASGPTPYRHAMYNAAHGRSTLALDEKAEKDTPYRWFRISLEDLPRAKAAAVAYLISGTLPDWPELSNQEIVNSSLPPVEREDPAL